MGNENTNTINADVNYPHKVLFEQFLRLKELTGDAKHHGASSRFKKVVDAYFRILEGTRRTKGSPKEDEGQQQEDDRQDNANAAAIKDAEDYEAQFGNLSALFEEKLGSDFDCELGGYNTEQIKKILYEQLQFAKLHLTKKSQSPESEESKQEAKPASDDLNDSLLVPFLQTVPGNDTPGQVLCFMRAILFKYVVFVAYLGSDIRFGERLQMTREDEDDDEQTTWQNQIIMTLLLQGDEDDDEKKQFAKDEFFHILQLEEIVLKQVKRIVNDVQDANRNATHNFENQKAEAVGQNQSSEENKEEQKQKNQSNLDVEQVKEDFRKWEQFHNLTGNKYFKGILQLQEKEDVVLQTLRDGDLILTILQKLVSDQGKAPDHDDKVKQKNIFVSIAKVLNLYYKSINIIDQAKKIELIDRIIQKDASSETYYTYFEATVRVLKGIQFLLQEHEQTTGLQIGKEVEKHLEEQCFTFEQVCNVIAALPDILELLELCGREANIDGYKQTINEILGKINSFVAQDWEPIHDDEKDELYNEFNEFNTMIGIRYNSIKRLWVQNLPRLFRICKKLSSQPEVQSDNSFEQLIGMIPPKSFTDLYLTPTTTRYNNRKWIEQFSEEDRHLNIQALMLQSMLKIMIEPWLDELPLQSQLTFVRQFMDFFVESIQNYRHRESKKNSFILKSSENDKKVRTMSYRCVFNLMFLFAFQYLNWDAKIQKNPNFQRAREQLQINEEQKQHDYKQVDENAEQHDQKQASEDSQPATNTMTLIDTTNNEDQKNDEQVNSVISKAQEIVQKQRNIRQKFESCADQLVFIFDKMKQYTNKDLDSLEQNDQQSKIDLETKSQQEEWQKLPLSIQEAFEHFDSTYDLYSAVVIMAIEFSENAFADKSCEQEDSKYELRVMIDTLLQILSSKNDLLALQKPVQDMARKQLIQRLVKLCAHLQKFAIGKLRLRRKNYKDLNELISRTWILSLQLYAYWLTHKITIDLTEQSCEQVKQEITSDSFMKNMMNFIDIIRRQCRREEEFEGQKQIKQLLLIPKQDEKVQLLRDNILATIEHKIIKEINNGLQPDDIEELQSMIIFIIKYTKIVFYEIELKKGYQNISEHPKIIKILPFLVRIQTKLDEEIIKDSQNRNLPSQDNIEFANLKFDRIYRHFDLAINDQLNEILDAKLRTQHGNVEFKNYMEQVRETYQELRQCIKEKEISNRYTKIKETQMLLQQKQNNEDYQYEDYQIQKDKILQQLKASKNAFQELDKAKNNNKGDEEGKKQQRKAQKDYNQEIKKLTEIEPLPVLNEFWDAYQEFQFVKAMQKHQVYNTVKEILDLTEQFESKFVLLQPLKPQKCDPKKHKYNQYAQDCTNRCHGQHKDYVVKFLSVERIYLKVETLKAVDTLIEAKIEDQAWIDQYHKVDRQKFFEIIKDLSKQLHCAGFLIKANEYSWQILFNEIREIRRSKRGHQVNFEEQFGELFDQMDQIYQDALNRRDLNQDQKPYSYFKIEAIEDREDGSTILPRQKGINAQFILQEISQFVQGQDGTQRRQQVYQQDMTSLQIKMDAIFGHGSLQNFNVTPNLQVLTRDVTQLYCSDEEYENLKADTRKYGHEDNLASEGVKKFYQITSSTNSKLEENFKERVEKVIEAIPKEEQDGRKIVKEQNWIRSSLCKLIEVYAKEEKKLTKGEQYEKVKQIFINNKIEQRLINDEEYKSLNKENQTKRKNKAREQVKEEYSDSNPDPESFIEFTVKQFGEWEIYQDKTLTIMEVPYSFPTGSIAQQCFEMKQEEESKDQQHSQERTISAIDQLDRLIKEGLRQIQSHYNVLLDKTKTDSEKEKATKEAQQLITNWLNAQVAGGLQIIIKSFFQNQFVFDISAMSANDETFRKLSKIYKAIREMQQKFLDTHEQIVAIYPQNQTSEDTPSSIINTTSNQTQDDENGKMQTWIEEYGKRIEAVKDELDEIEEKMNKDRKLEQAIVDDMSNSDPDDDDWD